MNYYETGKKDGKDQFGMDVLTETNRSGELVTYVAITSVPEHFEQAPDRLSVSQYVGGFVEGYFTEKWLHKSNQ